MYESRLREALPGVRGLTEEAAVRVGRDPSEITLVAVTKGHPPAAAEAALACGLSDLGENRVEELETKIAEVGRRRARWHMIGHVQRRKAPRLVGLCDLLHSVDSIRLAERLSRAAAEAGDTLSVLVQLNVSGEQAKGGFTADEALEALDRITGLPGLRIDGLMTMAPFTDDETVLRHVFRAVRAVHERALGLSRYTGTELSMGMTNDYVLAIEEGSTMIRLGTALFGERPR